MLSVLEKNRSQKTTSFEIEFGKKIGLFGTLFGCWHKHLSRPFTAHHQSYFVCLDCGARQHFDAQTFETYGAFYYPPNPYLK